MVEWSLSLQYFAMKRFIIHFFLGLAAMLLIVAPIVEAEYLSAGDIQVAASHSRTIVKKKVVKKVVKKKAKKVMKKKVMKKQIDGQTMDQSPGAGTTNAITTTVQKTWDVSILGMNFVQGSLTVKKGNSVKFTNKEDIPHQIASDPHPVHTNFTSLNSGILNKDGTFELTFNQTGTFTYHCHLHPNMKGTITVTE